MKPAWFSRIVAVAATMTLVASGVAFFLTPSSDTWPVRGLDISHHQGTVDFAELRRSEADLSFIFMKATEGGDWVDEHFEVYWRDAHRAGFAVGAYHFFTPCRSGRVQADNFIRVVPIEPGALPPVADAEMIGGCTDVDLDLEAPGRELLTFLQAIEAHYGKTPIIYVTLQFYDMFIAKISAFARYPLWVRSIDAEPVLSDGRTWTFWQFSNRGWVAGISGHVDRNVYRGSLEDFDRVFGLSQTNDGTAE